MKTYVEGIRYYLTYKDEAIKKTIQLLKMEDRQIAEIGYEARLKTLPGDGSPTLKGMQLVLDAAAEDDPKVKNLKVEQLVDLNFLR